MVTERKGFVMIILKEMARFNKDVTLDFRPDSKFPAKQHFDIVRIYGLYNTKIENYIDIAFANAINSDTANCVVWMIDKFTAHHIAMKFDLSALQKTLTIETTVVPYKGTKLTSVAETLWLTDYPAYLCVEYSPIKLDSHHKVISNINDTIRNVKVKDIPQEDVANLTGRFLDGVSFTEGAYVKKDSLITTYLKVDFDGFIKGEQMIFLSNNLEQFCEDFCRYIGADVDAISECGFKIKHKDSYFVVNQYESSCDSSCDSEYIYFEITYSKYPNLCEVIRNHDSFNSIKDAISRLLNDRLY